MDISQQLTNQELSAKLKVLGVEQVSYFYWLKDGGEWFVGGGDLQDWADAEMLSAFSVAELLVAFGPIELLRDGQLEDIRWLTRHQYSGIGDMYGYGKTDADSLGNLLIVMIEAGKIPVSSVNERMGAV